MSEETEKNDEIEEKMLFTAMFTRYEHSDTSIYDSVSHYKNVRTRDGCVVKKWLSLPADITRTIVGHLTQGEVISFLARVEFNDIEFTYPHALLNENINSTC